MHLSENPAEKGKQLRTRGWEDAATEAEGGRGGVIKRRALKGGRLGF